MELLVNSAHGVYAWQILINELEGLYRDQIKEKIGEENFKSLEAGPEDEFYWDATDAVERQTFVHEKGWNFTIEQMDGDIWAVPESCRETEGYRSMREC